MSVFEVGRTISESTGGHASAGGNSGAGNRFYFSDDAHAELGLQRGNSYDVRIRLKGNTSGYIKLTMIGHKGCAPNASGNVPFCYIVEALPQQMGVRTALSSTISGVSTKSFEDGIEAQHLMGLNAGDFYPTVSCFQYTGYTEIVLRVMNKSDTLEGSQNRSNVIDTTATDHSAALTKHYAGQSDNTVAGQSGEMGGDAIFFTAYIEGYSYNSTLSEGIFTSYNRMFGGRGIIVGGQNPIVDTIDYIAIGVLGNSADFGELFQARQHPGGASDGSRAFFACGGSPSGVDTIDYIKISTLGDSIDFGETSIAFGSPAGSSDGSRGVVAGLGPAGPVYTGIDYITIQFSGNSLDFGDLTVASAQFDAASDGSRGVFFGGQGAARHNVIQYISIGALGNAIDIGDISAIRYDHCGFGDGSRGISGGGHATAAPSDPEIDYFSIGTLGNASDFGDLLTEASYAITGISDGSRGIFAGDASSTNVIQYITVSTLGNGVDFGDMVDTKRYRGSESGD